MKDEKKLLLKHAAKLVILGHAVERERDKLKKLVKQGVPYTDARVLSAVERFDEVNAEWHQLEAEYLALKKVDEK